MKKMKLNLIVATAVISCCVAAKSHGAVVIASSYGINAKGKPAVSAGALQHPDGSTFLTRGLPTDSSTLASGFTLQNLLGNIPNVSLNSGSLNKYTFSVASCIDSFVSSVLFGPDEKIVGLGFASDITANIGLFVLGVEGARFNFAGYAPLSNGFEFEIYTASTIPPALPTAATPEPSTFLMWGGLVALCGASRSLRRLF